MRHSFPYHVQGTGGSLGAFKNRTFINKTTVEPSYLTGTSFYQTAYKNIYIFFNLKKAITIHMRTQDSHHSYFKLAFQRENGGFLVGK